MQLPWSRGRDFFSELGEGSLHVMVAIQGPAERLPSPIARLGREEKKCPVSAFRLPAFGTSSPLHPCASVHHHLCSTTPADSRNILHLFDLVGCYGAGHNHHTSGSSTATRAWTQRQSACRTRPSTAPSLLVAPVVGEGCGRCAMLRRCAEGSQRQHARSSGPTSPDTCPCRRAATAQPHRAPLCQVRRDPMRWTGKAR